MDGDNYYLIDGNLFYVRHDKTSLCYGIAQRFTRANAEAKVRELNAEGANFRILRIEEV